MARSGVTTGSLLELLQHGSPEEICAASLVLGALTPTPSRVIPVLARVLEGVGSVLEPYLLDALGHYDDPRALARIAPFLLRQGALREQSGRLMAQSPSPIAPAIDAILPDADTTVQQAMMQVLGRHGQPEDLALMVSILEKARFPAARSFFSSVRRHRNGWPRANDRNLAGLLLSSLSEEAFRDSPDGLISGIKTLGLLADQRAITPLMRLLVNPKTPLGVRRNCGEALACIAIPRPRRAKIRRELSPLLDHEDGRLGLGVFQVLRSFDGIGVEELARLTRSENSQLAFAAVEALAETPAEPSVLAPLLEALDHRNPDVQASAATALARIPAAAAPLIEAAEDRDRHRLRPLLLQALSSLGTLLDPPQLRAQVRHFLPTTIPPESLESRLQTLGAFAPETLAATVERRAQKALARGEVLEAITLLEALVRNRLANPSGRYLLGIAHWIAQSDQVDPEAERKRAVNLLGPLARIEQAKLQTRLLRERRLSSEAMRALIQLLAERGPAEAALARVLGPKLEARTRKKG